MSQFTVNGRRKRRLRMPWKKDRHWKQKGKVTPGQRINPIKQADREAAAIEGLVVNRAWKKRQKKARWRTLP